MKKLTAILLAILLLFALGCSRKVVVIKTSPPEKEQPTVAHKAKVNNEASNNHLRQAKKFYFKGKYKQTQQHCEKAIEFNHRNWEAHYYLGLAMQKRRHYARAVEMLAVGLKFSPDNNFVKSEIHFAIGYSWEKMGDHSNAGKAYKMALSYNPGNQEARDARNRLKVEKTMKNWGKDKDKRPEG
ncbi:MAG: tetratricopeptide repeat protein [Candidatus Zixiibacteriota bacterium]|nr:MAG: tetratricopeptide repeat protein [candidate division Zixibacteria bacterium]